MSGAGCTLCVSCCWLAPSCCCRRATPACSCPTRPLSGCIALAAAGNGDEGCDDCCCIIAAGLLGVQPCWSRQTLAGDCMYCRCWLGGLHLLCCCLRSAGGAAAAHASAHASHAAPSTDCMRGLEGCAGVHMCWGPVGDAAPANT